MKEVRCPVCGCNEATVVPFENMDMAVYVCPYCGDIDTVEIQGRGNDE